MRYARSVGLYQKLKYMMHAGTNPDSGMPRKKRAVSKPAAFFVAAIHMTTVLQMVMITGKYRLAEYFFMSRLEGINKMVTTK